MSIPFHLKTIYLHSSIKKNRRKKFEKNNNSRTQNTNFESLERRP